MQISNYIIKLGEYIYRVYPFDNGKKLELGNAYTFGSKKHKDYGTLKCVYVLPYCGYYNKDSEEVGIYTDKETGRLKYIHPATPNEKATYSLDRVREVNADTINTDLVQYLKEIDPNELKFSGNVFVPPIYPEDDIGMKAIRLAITSKQINYNAYKGRHAVAHDASNMKKNLLLAHTSTFAMIKKYCEIFDLELALLIYDSKDSKDPMFKNMNGDIGAIMVADNAPYPVSDTSIKLVNSIDDVIPQYDDSIITTEDEDEEDD